MNDLIALRTPLYERWKAPLVRVNRLTSPQLRLLQHKPVCFSSDGASSPDALRHEFESYLREPKIAPTSSPFAGLVT